MKEIFDFLDQKERKIVELLCLFLVIALFFLFFIALGEKRAYFRTLDSFSAKEKDYQKLTTSEIQKKREWMRWRAARRDMNELKEKYFYDNKDAISKLRLNLQQIFNKTGIRVSGGIGYDYAELKEGKVKKIIVSFNLTGSYFSVKKFINFVEKFPKFLVIEKIDFLDIKAQGEMLELKVVLAGYYEG